MFFRRTISDWRFWIWTFIAATLVLAYLSLIKAPTLPIGFDTKNRTAHFIAYFVYGIITSMWRFTRPQPGATVRRPNLRGFGEAALITVVYGTILEWLQMYFPNRESDPIDGLCNALGGIIGATAGWFITSKYLRNPHHH